jgi:kinesin family protein 3/17
VFAYGQTGTGKTWTMEGDRKSNTNKGIICRSFEHVFKTINGSPDKQFLVSVSMLELYNEEIRDLIKGDGQKLKLKQDENGTVYVDGLSQTEVKSDADCMRLLDSGSGNKAVASTDMNARSSRSHSIFTITVEQSSINPETGDPEIKKGKLNLVDLAGSERQAKTGATGDRFKEARSINLSLTTLGNVI